MERIHGSEVKTQGMASVGSSKVSIIAGIRHDGYLGSTSHFPWDWDFDMFE